MSGLLALLALTKIAAATLEDAAAQAFEIDGDSVEAEARAFLAVRSRLGLPITFPGTMGVARALTGGVIAGDG